MSVFAGQYLGELAALATSLCFSFTSTFFTLAGRQVGSLVVNRLRLVVAVGLLVGVHWALLGSPLPVGAGGDRWFWLGVSGVIGLVLGDAFLFQAFVWIGPRLSMLLMSLAPVIAALLAWAFLAETLSPGQVLGVGLTVGGIGWVALVRDQVRESGPAGRRDYMRGLLFGLGGATGQALGLVTARLGLGGDFSPLSGNLIRMLAALITLWAVTLLARQGRSTLDRLRAQPRAVWLILAGAFSGPFLGVTFSLLAIQRTQIGVASTLMALPPVFLLPVGALVFQERIGWRAVLGTLAALAGVALLFLL